MLKAMFIFIMCSLNFSVFAQDLIITNKQNLVMPNINRLTDKVVETEKVYIRSSLSLSMYLIGIGTLKVNYVVPGLRSCTRFNQSEDIIVFISSKSDSTTLLKEIDIFKLKQDNRRLYRFTEFKKWTTFTGNTYAENDTVDFTINKRNYNLYSVEFKTNLSTGEYAIRLPGITDSLRLFGID